MTRHARHWDWRWSLLAAAILGLAACGGGGGGGDDDGGETGDDPAPPLPSTLAFSGGLTDGVPMLISADGMGLSVTGFGFRGTWDRIANRYVLPANGTSLNIDLGLGGTLVTGVTETASWVGIPPPAQSGTISAQSLPVPSGMPLFTGIASMTVLSEAAVRLSWNGTVPPTTVDYSWDTFLNADLPADWQTGIQAGVAVLALQIDKVQLALEQFVFINARDAQLAAAGAAGVATACAGGSGTRLVVWNDTNRDGALGPGDGFTVTFSNCLVDLPGDIDQRLDGRLVISGYIENSSPFSVGGRVDLVDLKQTETDAEAMALSTTGSFQLFVSGP